MDERRDDETARSTRRRFLVGSLAATASALVAACGDDAAPSTEPRSAATSSGADPFPVEVVGALGPITVERRLERVVTVGYLRDTDIAVALGVVPVGIADRGLFEGGLAPWVADALAGTSQPELLPGESVNLEQVAALRPDLILATDSFTLEEDYGALSAIAPTLSYKTGRNDDSWQTMATHIGPALGKTAEADALVADAEAELAAARRDHPELEGKTFTFGPVQPDGRTFTINRTDDASAALLGELGLVLSPQVTALPEGTIPNRTEISAEQLDLIDADVVLLTFSTDESPRAFESRPLFEQLPSVQRGSYVPMDFDTALAFAFASVLSIPYGLRQTLPRIVDAIA
ncbi:MAG: ABC transporter substrate-binding protein [Acidimicrobiia bacterium]|nr:ABC transporter substrate-binding protein [Acidimicrobiia bacterium]